jgi:hypothetical protein
MQQSALPPVEQQLLVMAVLLETARQQLLPWGSAAAAYKMPLLVMEHPLLVLLLSRLPVLG